MVNRGSDVSQAGIRIDRYGLKNLWNGDNPNRSERHWNEGGNPKLAALVAFIVYFSFHFSSPCLKRGTMFIYSLSNKKSIMPRLHN